MLVDVRSANEYEAAHVPGAVNVPLETIAEHVEDLRAMPGLELICWTSARSRLAADALRAHGIEATVREGGTKAWLDAGKPVVGTRQGGAVWAIERQIRFSIGVFVVLLAGALAAGASAALLLLFLLGGLLLLTSAVGICPLGLLLQRMPWNRK